MLKESKADIFVDPVLHTACALDIKHHCAAIAPGRGRRECKRPPLNVSASQNVASDSDSLSPRRDVLPDGGAAGQEGPFAARVQEATPGSHRHVELRRQGRHGDVAALFSGCSAVASLSALSLSVLQVAPAEGFSDLAVQVMTSPSKYYILFMIALSVCILFLVGLLCGRITKPVTREHKDR